MSAPPLRRRDRQPGLNQDYYAQPGQPPYDEQARFYASQDPPRSRQHEQQPPRRHKSERRRPQTPDYDGGYEKPSRRRNKHDRPEVINSSSSARRSPPSAVTPPYAPSPPTLDRHRDRHRDSRQSRDPREHRPRRRETMPSPGRDFYDPYTAGAVGGYPADYGDDRPSKSYRGEPEYRPPRRSRHSPTPANRRPISRDPHDRDPPDRRLRARDYPPPSHSDDRYGAPLPPRPRSHSRGAPRAKRAPEYENSPPPPPRSGRSRPRPAAGAGAPGPAANRARRSSMPASTKPRGTPWWQNPLVQAGARQAFSAGAQAAIRAKDDNGPWLGPRGAKVATAALSAALVDGMLGHKHGGSARQQVLRTGADAAQDYIAKGEIPHRRRH